VQTRSPILSRRMTRMRGDLAVDSTVFVSWSAGGVNVVICGIQKLRSGTWCARQESNLLPRV
jgi:hypothetical protein